MNPDLINALQALALKLNITVEHIWRIAIERAMVHGTIDGITGFLIMLFGLGVPLTCFLYWRHLHDYNSRCETYNDRRDTEPISAVTTVATLLGCAVIIMGGVTMFHGVKQIAAPEAAALEFIFSSLRSLR